MGVGGSDSYRWDARTGRAGSENYGYGQSTTFVDPNQQPYLNILYNDALGQHNATVPGMRGLTNTAQNTQLGAVGQLAGLGNTQQVINSQLTGLQSGLTDIYNQGMGQIGDNAIAAGAFGGSRQGVAEGVLGGEIGKAYTQGYGDIIANASRQAIDANNSAIAGAGQMLSSRILGDYGGLQALAGILGGPTVLSQSRDERSGSSYSIDDALSIGGSESSEISLSPGGTSGGSGSGGFGFGK